MYLIRVRCIGIDKEYPTLSSKREYELGYINEKEPVILKAIFNLYETNQRLFPRLSSMAEVPLAKIPVIRNLLVGKYGFTLTTKPASLSSERSITLIVTSLKHSFSSHTNIYAVSLGTFIDENLL